MSFLLISLLFLSPLFVSSPALSAQEPPPPPEISGSITWESPRQGWAEIHYSYAPNSYQSRTENFFTITPLESPDGLVWGDVVYPEGDKYRRKVTLRRSFTLTEGGNEGNLVAGEPFQIEMEAAWQLCDEEGVCYIPSKKTITLEGTLPQDATLPQEGTSSSAASSSPSLLPLMGFLLLALAGGFLLNLMPCVLPLLSVKAMQLVKQSGERKELILRNSWLYTAGILSSFALLALVIILIKGSGELIGWGFQFQNPGFVLFLTAVIWVFTLALFDVFTLNPVAAGSAQKASRRGDGWGSFLTGIFAVLVATPCTAPFLGAALAFAFTQPPLIILISFLMVGLGLSLPFLILGFFPRLIKALPKPGRWMDIFKEAMAFLLAGTALHLLKVLHALVAPGLFWDILWFMLALTFITWFWGKLVTPTASRKKKRLGVLISLLLLVGTFFFLDMPRLGQSAKALSSGGEGTSVITEDLREGWETFSPEVLQKLRDKGEPVFVIFSAEWCLSCQTNEDLFLKTERMDRLLEETGTRLLYGDYTAPQDTITLYIQKWNRAGVPVYAYFAPGAENPRLLPEILTWNLLEGALR